MSYTIPTIQILDQYIRKQDGVHLSFIQMVGLSSTQMAFKNQTIWHLTSFRPFDYQTSSVFRSPLMSEFKFGGKAQMTTKTNSNRYFRSERDRCCDELFRIRHWGCHRLEQGCPWSGLRTLPRLSKPEGHHETLFESGTYTDGCEHRAFERRTFPCTVFKWYIFLTFQL